MAVPVFSVERFDLGLKDIDGAAALEALLADAACQRGFLIEKSGPDEDKVFLGVDPFEILRVRQGQVIQEFRSGRRKILPGNPFKVLGRRLQSFRLKSKALPFSTGAVGNLNYEMVRHLEKLPAKPGAEEEGWLMFFDAIITCDRRAGKTELVTLGKGGAKARRIAALLQRLKPAAAPNPKIPAWLSPMAGTLGRQEFYQGVQKIKEHIRAGDIFQCVLSELFKVPVSVSPWVVYRGLAQVNPSPYIFFLKDGKEHLIGTSPERLIKVVNGMALNCPIAGTRPRGKDRRQDELFARALRRSPKENAEHLMLVDLARNDLGRVCAPGTIQLRDFLRVRRFANIMHLVSEVQGKLEGGRTAWEAFAASFPAGTVSGAPKVRAMEIISEIEPRARGFYAGAFLQHDFSGNLDSCISIRTLSLSDGEARLQAGAGIVADSTPKREYQEVLNKLLGLRRALAWAECQ